MLILRLLIKYCESHSKSTSTSFEIFYGPLSCPYCYRLPIMSEATKTPIPEGMNKSGRVWKIKQTTRTSAQKRQGVLSHLAKSFEEKELIRKRKLEVKHLEDEMINAKKRKIAEEKEKAEERKKRRAENEQKTVTYQALRPEKIKSMSKKQLRAVRKTSMNQETGQIELVSPWADSKPKSIKKIFGKK